MDTLIINGKSAKNLLVAAGCVPQGSKDLKELEGVSVVGVQQIDRVVEVVEEAFKGHEVRVRNIIANGVKKIWISSEDTRAYGRNIGANLLIILKAIVVELPSDRSMMF
ncbi:hypothetical protein GIB67_025852 [Kingdonia uniflora]|uniref:Uncharacterized protein n=1 Tax=Kingdonia uniflora TaxID=39325 RepID=A0A7J7MDJ3_9MAGN|nr:hypothetical protein GIB67_025852 [Kingdonia uniflora]